jgi:hypothetical protein
MGLMAEKKPVYTVTILFKSGERWAGLFHSFKLTKAGADITSVEWVTAPGYQILSLNPDEIAMVTSEEK